MSTWLYKHTRENRLEDIDMERNWKARLIQVENRKHLLTLFFWQVALPRMTEKLNSKVYSEGEEESVIYTYSFESRFICLHEMT